MTWLLSPVVLRAMAVAAILAALAWGYHLWADHQRETGRQEVRAEWQADKLARSEATRLLIVASAKAQSDLQVSADKERQALNAKNRSINRDLADALGRLHNRPERPNAGSVPEVATAGVGCTGAGLFAADAEFLVREAGRADKLRARAETCEAAYNAARDTLASWPKPSQP